MNMPAMKRMVSLAPTPSPQRHNVLDVRMVRDPQYGYSRSNKVQLTPSAMAFIIPVIIMFVLGPVIIIWLIRRRRRRQTHTLAAYRVAAAARRSKRIPEIGRAEAKARLDGATDVVQIIDDEVCKYDKRVDGKQSDMESASTAERECAICLSTLHAPSAPVPAKIVEKTSTSSEQPPPTTSASSTSLSAAEEILRLKTCAHEFHAECLISWCALGKVSCPICRAVYYGDVEGNAKAEERGTEAAETVRVEDVGDTRR